MGKVVAVTGKGGVGKTAVATMVLRVLLDAGARPILAVDADPNANLHTALGLTVELTLGGIRESEIEERNLLPPGMSKPEYFEYRTRQALVEASGFDLLSMGCPEGPGCYCFANSMLRDALLRLENSYAWVVVDCEAGLEHFSRRTASSIDLLVVLADRSRRSLDTIRTVTELAQRLKTPVAETLIMVNRCDGQVPEPLLRAAQELGLTIAACLPEDEEITRRDMAGEPLLTVPPESALLRAVHQALATTATVGPALPSAARGI